MYHYSLLYEPYCMPVSLPKTWEDCWRFRQLGPSLFSLPA